MSKFFIVFFITLLTALFLYGGVVFFNRYVNTERQMARVVDTMSQGETAHVSVVLRRSALPSVETFSFGDVRFKGVVDFRSPLQSAYALHFDLASVPGVSSERVTLSARQHEGVTSVQVNDAPKTILDVLEARGIYGGAWNTVPGTAGVLALLGEKILWPTFSSEDVLALREAVKQTSWVLDSKATLTEIVHGRVTRIFTATLDAEGIVAFQKTWMSLQKQRALTPVEEAQIESNRSRFEGARVNLWIDQRAFELHRVVVQLASGDTLDVEFSEWNQDVTIEQLSERTGLPGAMDRQEPLQEEVIEETSSTEENAPSVETTQTFSTPGDADGDGLTDDLEGFYGSDRNNPDTDGDGFTDGEEVKNGYNPTGNGSLFNFGLPTL